jgi:uncharacterized protein (DUF2147 family)
MKKLYIIAALLMASTAAHAGNSVSFEIDGHKIHIEAPKNCDQLSCIKISGQGLSGINLKGLKGFKSNDDDETINDPTPSAQNPAAAPAAQATTPPVPAPVVNSAPPAPATVATTTPAPVTNEVAPVIPAPVAAAPAPQPAPVAAAPAPASTTPLGVWATEENKGNVRIEQCGQNLCGYAVNTGERILINMKPSDSKWTGQIHDPDSGRNYDSTIAMKGTNTLKVQGCAFGGLFCGGQTWKRIS